MGLSQLGRIAWEKGSENVEVYRMDDRGYTTVFDEVKNKALRVEGSDPVGLGANKVA